MYACAFFTSRIYFSMKYITLSRHITCAQSYSNATTTAFALTLNYYLLAFFMFPVFVLYYNNLFCCTLKQRVKNMYMPSRLHTFNVLLWYVIIWQDWSHTTSNLKQNEKRKKSAQNNVYGMQLIGNAYILSFYIYIRYILDIRFI